MIANVRTEERAVPGWMRGLEIVFGVLSLVFAVLVLAYPGLAVLTLLLYLSVALLFLGIRQIIIGAGIRWLAGWLRALHVLVGVLVLLFGFMVIGFPGLGVATLIVLLASGLFLFGVTEIAVGVGARFMRGWHRGLLVVFGVLDLVVAPIALLIPAVAVAILIALLAVFLMLSGIDLIVTAAVGRVNVVRASVAPAAGRGPA